MTDSRLTLADKIKQAVDDNKSEFPRWIHLDFPENPGIDFEKLIREALPADAKILFHIDFNYCGAGTTAEFYRLICASARHFRTDFRRFLQRFPRRQQSDLRRFFTGKFHLPDFAAFSSRGMTDLFLAWLHFLSSGRRTILLLENVLQTSPANWNALRQILVARPSLPVLIFSTGRFEHPAVSEYMVTIPVPALSRRETEQFVRSYLNTHPINAQIITNQLFLKTGGNRHKIVFYLEAFYRDILPGNRTDLLDPGRLPVLRAAASMETVYSRVLERLLEPERSLLGFISQFDAPFPMEMIRKMPDGENLRRQVLSDWEKRYFVKIVNIFNREYLLLEPAAWKKFLRNHVPPETFAARLEHLKRFFLKSKQQIPVQASHLYFAQGDHGAAEKMARREADRFMEMERYRRALERLNFAWRISRDQERRKAHDTVILSKIALCQEKLGLFENSFETYRVWRDSLDRKDSDEWLKVSLLMAKSLYRMDSLAEANYIVRDLNIKKRTGVLLRAGAQKLMGDLEQNRGHADYAMRHYGAALKLLSESAKPDETLAGDLYRSVRGLRTEMADDKSVFGVFAALEKMLPDTLPLKYKIRNDLIQRALSKNNYQKAMSLAISAYRHLRYSLDFRQFFRTVFYLCEIEAVRGKWQLCLLHFQKLLAHPAVLPNSREVVHIQLQLAIVEKELGRFGASLNRLRQLQEVCRRENFETELHETLMHIGHIYLLVHSRLQAQDYLRRAFRWAENNPSRNLYISAALFMAAYEIQGGHSDKAEAFLQRAEAALSGEPGTIDHLNFLYYTFQWQLLRSDFGKAADTLQEMREKSCGIMKFQLLSKWCAGRLASLKDESRAARKAYKAALKLAGEHNLLFYKLQILAELERTASGGSASEKHSAALSETFFQVKKAIGDSILAAQFAESREIADILSELTP